MKIYIRWIILLGLLGFSGCGHYKLGEPQATSGVKHLRLGSITNKSFAPQLEAQLRRDLELLFSRDKGRVHLKEPAQGIVDIVITDYNRIASVKQERDGLVPRAFSLEATAQCTLRSPEGKEFPLFTRPKIIQARVELVRDTQALQAEYQSMPQLSLELAKKIHNSLTQLW